jgi:DNA-binding response OmpR family regulator
MRRILIIEDDEDIALSLKYKLEQDQSFAVVIAPDGTAGLQAAERERPDIVLLDLNLPGLDGMEVCRSLRAKDATRHVPIIMLTARVDESDKIAGLELGADDYVTKPFSVREVAARIRAVLRRGILPAEQEDPILVVGPLRVDEATRLVTVHGDEVPLTRKEFDLLVSLIRARGRVLSREQLLEMVWGYSHPGETRTVDVHVRQLRKKLGTESAAYIQTAVGVGYRFREPS